MPTRQGVCSLWKNPVFTERQHRTLWMATQILAFGFILGIMSRAAWDHGIVASMALAFRDLGVAVWIMLQNFADACSDFFRFVSR